MNDRGDKKIAVIFYLSPSVPEMIFIRAELELYSNIQIKF